MTDLFEQPEKTIQEPARDQWGRYLLPHPTTGKLQAWTRATTFAKTTADTFALNQWATRMVMKGLLSRPDLMALAASTPFEDKKELNSIAEKAKDAANAHAAANMGNAYHAWTQAIDSGETPTIPEAYRADIDAYTRLLTNHRISTNADWIERRVVVPSYNVAGTFDRIVAYGGDLVVADLKTGRDLSYGWAEIAVQLALYANASHIYVDDETGYVPMPSVSRVYGLVMHLPIGKGEATLYRVDLKEGWRAADLCHRVRLWRNNRRLAEPIEAVTEGQLIEIGYADRLRLATSRGELSAIWKEALDKGWWDAGLEKIGKDRLVELTSG